MAGQHVIVLAPNSSPPSLKFDLYRVSTGQVDALPEGQLDALAPIAPLHTRASAAACTPSHSAISKPSRYLGGAGCAYLSSAVPAAQRQARRAPANPSVL